MSSRVERNAVSLATSMANAGTVCGVRAGDPSCKKEWVATGVNTRDSHAKMNGERVGIGERFSNGAMWPGDTVLPAWETCNCRCRIEVVSGGVNVTRNRRIQRRIEESEVVHDDLYDETPDKVEEFAKAINKEEGRQWEMGYRKSDRSAKSYRETYGSYVESFSPEGRIKVEDFTRLEGKELQLAQWLAGAGHTVEFRNADKHLRSDGKTTDVFLDGELWEFKRSSSKSIAKMTRLITERLDRQGPRFVVDLSISKTNHEDAVERIATLLEDERIEQIMVVRDGCLTLYKK